MFEGIQINDRSTSCAVLSLTCFGAFFIEPTFAAFSDFQFDPGIQTVTYHSIGPGPVPEPASWLLLATFAGVILLRSRTANFISRRLG